MKPIRICLVYDVPGWACEGEVRSLAKHLEANAPGRFAPTFVQTRHLRTTQFSQSDVLYSMHYYHLLGAQHPKAISVISSYSYWTRKGWEGGWPHLREWRYMVAKNKHIQSLLTPEDHPNVTQLYHILDPDKWFPGRAPAHDTFRVGFAGHRNQALKGYALIEQAVKRIPGCELVTAAFEADRIPADQMPAFYHGLDVYVCMSKPGQDAGPNPPMEAGLCGVPVITTRVGQIGEMVEDGKTGLVIDRTVDALEAALLRLKGDREFRTRLAANIRPAFFDRWVTGVGKDWTSYLLQVAEGQP